MGSGFNGYLMLNKEIKRHEFFRDHKTFRLFWWLVMDANFIEGKMLGITVMRGQKLTSFESLAIETNLKIPEVRTALNKLIKSNHIIKKSTNKYTLLTVVEYEYYTGSNENKNKQKANQRQTKDKPKTTIEEYNNLNKEELNKIERADKILSHFDFLNSNFKSDIDKLVKEYRPKIVNFDFCIEKFNNYEFSKEVSVIRLEQWFKDEIDFKLKKNNNNNFNEGKNELFVK